MSKGHKYKDAVKELKENGFKLDTNCKRSSHEIWRHSNGKTILVSRCGSRSWRALKNLRSQIKQIIKG